MNGFQLNLRLLVISLFVLPLTTKQANDKIIALRPVL
jgi:hypothetical protein